MNTRVHWATITLATAVLLIGCGHEFEPDVVAKTKDDALNLSDLDAAILRRPEAERILPVAAIDRTNWFENRARDELFRRHLLRLAQVEGSEVKDQLADRFRVLRLRAFLGTLDASEPPPADSVNSDSEVVVDVRREVFHLFLRSDQDALTLAQQIANRVNTVSDFVREVRAHSQSTSKSKDGLLGWLGRDDLPDAASDIVFTLEVGQVSDPLQTRDGVHLFLVSEELDRRPYLEQLKNERERQVSQYQQMVTSVASLAADSSVEVEVLVTEDNWPTSSANPVLAKVGGVELKLDYWRTWLDSFDALPALSSQQFLEDLVHAEAAMQATDYQASAGVLAEQKELLATAQLQVELTRFVEENQDQLTDFFKRNARRFYTSVGYELRMLPVSVGDDPSAVLSTLQRMQAEGDALDDIARHFGLPTPVAQWVDLPVLQAQSPLFAEQLRLVKDGGVSRPVRRGDTFLVGAVDAVRQPQPGVLDLVRPQVIAMMVEERQRDLYLQRRDQFLEAAELRINRSLVEQL